MSEHENNKSVQQKDDHISPLTLQGSIITKLFQAGKHGDVLTREEIVAACKGLLVTDGVITGARYRCLRQSRIWWQTIRGTRSWKCSTDAELVKIAQDDMKKVHRASKRAVRKLATANTANLSDAEKVKANSLLAQHGTLAAFSTTGTTKALEVRQASQPVDTQKMLEMFKK